MDRDPQRRISISEGEVGLRSAAGSVGQRMQAASRTARISILSLGGRSAGRSTVELVLVSFIPFLNSLVWFEDSGRRRGAAKAGSLLASLALGAASLIGVAFLGSAIAARRGGGTDEEAWAAIDSAAQSGVVFLAVADGAAACTGTGFVVATDDSRALIATNKHVVWLGSLAAPGSGPATSCTVKLRSGVEIPGQVAGFHRHDAVDLALIVCDRAGLRPLGPIGRFEGVTVGADVAAIGHPEGNEWVMSRGSVEKLHEDMLIQMSAELWHGNSGGPLLDGEGRIIGVNAILFGAAQSQGEKYLAFRADLLLRPEEWECSPDARALLSKVKRE